MALTPLLHSDTQYMGNYTDSCNLGFTQTSEIRFSPRQKSWSLFQSQKPTAEPHNEQHSPPSSAAVFVAHNVKTAGRERMERWYVDISDWNPSNGEFNSAMSVLPQHEHSSITRYVRMADRKRALVSRLLQYVLVHHVMGIPLDEIVVKRTVEGKPYLDYDGANCVHPNFNFNVSHHGDFVGIASEPLFILGLDIVSPVVPVNESVQEFIQHFSSYFSSLEWDRIENAGNSEQILTEFYRYWCLKESFVKAIGAGLAYQVDNVEFHHNGWADIRVQINGKKMDEWKFWLQDLGKGHWASVAVGHPRSAVESFKKTLKQVALIEELFSRAMQLSNASFVKKTVDQLIQVSRQEKKY